MNYFDEKKFLIRDDVSSLTGFLLFDKNLRVQAFQL